MSYEQFSHFAGTWGLVLLVIMFAVTMGYAFWPGNKKKFDHAAQMPLNDGDKRS